jgi:hypothetical protein
LLDVDRLALIGEARIAGDYEQRLEPRQRGNDETSKASAELNSFALSNATATIVAQWFHRLLTNDY